MVSVCDEGWGKWKHKKDFGFLDYRSQRYCPCLQLAPYDAGAYCGLLLWMDEASAKEFANLNCWENPYPTDLPTEPPAECPHKVALRAVAMDRTGLELRTSDDVDKALFQKECSYERLGL